MRIIGPFILIALLNACVAPSGRTPAPDPRPAPATPTPPPSSPATPTPASTEWQYRPATPGDWTYRSDATGSVALFAPTGGGTLSSILSVHCDRANRKVSFVRPGAGSTTMTIRTSYGAVSWPASPNMGSGTGAAPETVATRAANDTVLDQVAYSRGRFGVEVQGLSPLILPAWAEVARVIEDCRG